jgi:hypothetical protein
MARFSARQLASEETSFGTFSIFKTFNIFKTYPNGRAVKSS